MLRAFWRFLEADDLLQDKQVRFFQGDRIPKPRVDLVVREIYEDEQIEALLVVADARGKAIILMLLESGMRASELCSLTEARVDAEKRQGIVVAKGGSDRFVWWGERASRALQHYKAQQGCTDKMLICCQDGSKLTVNSIQSMLRRLAKKAGIKLPLRAVHAFRHTFARRALMRGVDALHLQQLLGHSSSKTTERYVKECPEKLRQVHQRIWRLNS